MLTAPPGFAVHHPRPRTVVIVRVEDLAWFPTSELIDPARLIQGGEASRDPTAPGRGATASVRAGGRGLIVKKYRRGGALAPLLPDLFLAPGRMVDDLNACTRARERGVPCPLPVALVFERTAGALWAGYLVTEELPSAETLDRALAREGDPPAALRLAERAVRTVRQLHDAGVVHRDLNLGNLLVSGGVVHVIDLDGAAIVASADAESRFANLSRLDRSYLKGFGEKGPLSHADRVGLLETYAGEDRVLADALRALLPRHKASLRRHGLAWSATRVRS